MNDNCDPVLVHSTDGVFLSVGLNKPVSEKAVALFMTLVVETLSWFENRSRQSGGAEPNPHDVWNDTLEYLHSRLANDRRSPIHRPSPQVLAQFQALLRALDKMSEYQPR